jgi:hypothetical protein
VSGRETRHVWDEDAVCIRCGHDGAEWHWWKHHTYEGQAQTDATEPLCSGRFMTYERAIAIWEPVEQ